MELGGRIALISTGLGSQRVKSGEYVLKDSLIETVILRGLMVVLPLLCIISADFRKAVLRTRVLFLFGVLRVELKEVMW